MNDIAKITRRLTIAVESGRHLMTDLAYQFNVIAKQTADLVKALKEVNNA